MFANQLYCFLIYLYTLPVPSLPSPYALLLPPTSSPSPLSYALRRSSFTLSSFSRSILRSFFSCSIFFFFLFFFLFFFFLLLLFVVVSSFYPMCTHVHTYACTHTRMRRFAVFSICFYDRCFLSSSSSFFLISSFALGTTYETLSTLYETRCGGLLCNRNPLYGARTDFPMCGKGAAGFFLPFLLSSLLWESHASSGGPPVHVRYYRPFSLSLSLSSEYSFQRGDH